MFNHSIATKMILKYYAMLLFNYKNAHEQELNKATNTQPVSQVFYRVKRTQYPVTYEYYCNNKKVVLASLFPKR